MPVESAVGRSWSTWLQLAGSTFRSGPGGQASLWVGLRLSLGLALSKLAILVFGVRGPAPTVTGVVRTSLWGSFLRWDAIFYNAISISGYLKGNPERTSFFPLYPALLRVARAVGLGSPITAEVLSWLALFFATWGVIRLAGALGATSPYRAGALLCWAPASVFLLSGYVESTYIALIAWTCVLLVEGRPWIAAVVAAVASAARPEGALAGLLVVAWAFVNTSKLKLIVLGILSELGLIGFSLFLWTRYGSPVEYFKAQTAWGRTRTYPLHPLVWTLETIVRGQPVGPRLLGANSALIFLVDDALTLVVLAAIVLMSCFALRDQRLRFFLPFLVGYFILIVSNGPGGKSPEGSSRLFLCLVPLYYLVSRLRSESLWAAVLAVSAGSAVVLQVVFNTGWWFT